MTSLPLQRPGGDWHVDPRDKRVHFYKSTASTIRAHAYVWHPVQPGFLVLRMRGKGSVQRSGTGAPSGGPSRERL